MTDLDALLPAIAAGDDHAFAAWLARAEAPLRRGLRRFAADVDVEAALQEALLRTWHFAGTVRSDGRGNSLLRFAGRVAHNLCVDELRRRGREVDLDHAAEPSIDPDPPPDPRLRERLRRCVDQLPDQPRRAFDARSAAGHRDPDRDLAAALEMTLNTFLKNVGRAREALRACLERAGFAWPGVTS
jgi:RNA polymerase sigma-70 factor (ECF subfamily)